MLANPISLDVNTLLVVTVANVVVLALASPAVMGLRPGPAAYVARWSLATHALSWVCMILSNLWPESLADRLLSTASIACFGLTHRLLYAALGCWLGPRPFRRSLDLLALATPLGYFALFGDYAWRVGWANFLLALQVVLVAAACLRPQTALRGPWRWVVAVSLWLMAGLTLGRGLLGAFTDLYPSFLTPHPLNVLAMLMSSQIPLLVNFAVLGGWHEEAEIALRHQAVTDALTQLLNRRGWLEVARPLVANASRHHQPLALMMLDLDHFKKINDTHGHEAGDRALAAFGELLAQSVRAGDVAARIGGEEFYLLLPTTDAQAAQVLDLRLRERLRARQAQLGHALDYSAGLAVQQEGETLSQMMGRADKALYQAKDQGRGCLVIAPAAAEPAAAPAV